MKKGDKFVNSFVISQEVYNGFISVFKDENPLHTDEEFAKEAGFTNKVMHGNILNGFISYFIGECLPTKRVLILAQKIKFAFPVYLYDELMLKAEISDVYESVNTIELKFYFQNAGNQKVARGNIQIGLLR